MQMSCGQAEPNAWEAGLQSPSTDVYAAAAALQSLAESNSWESDPDMQDFGVDAVTDTHTQASSIPTFLLHQVTEPKYLSVLSKLTTICSLPPLVEHIKRTCILVKQVRLEGMHIANLHVRRCLAMGGDMPALNNMFFYGCMVSSLRQIERRDRHSPQPFFPYLHDTLVEYWEAREQAQGYSSVELINYGSVIGDLAKQMAVNATNMIIQEFRRRLRQYIRFRFRRPGQTQLPLSETTRLLESCYRVRTRPVMDAEGNETGQTERIWTEWDETADPVERQLRQWLGIVPWKPLIRDNLAHFLIKTYDMLVSLEYYVNLRPRARGTKLYSLLPLVTTYTADFIPINGSTLYEMLAHIKHVPTINAFLHLHFNMVTTQPRSDDGEVGFNRDQILHRRDEMMRAVFDVALFETSSRVFATKVMTDGYGAYVLLERPETRTTVVAMGDSSDTHSQLDRFQQDLIKLGPEYSPDVIIGVDPGTINLCTAVSVGRLPPRHYRHCERLKNRRPRRRKRRKKRNRRYQRGQKITQISTGEYRHLAKMNHFDSWTKNLRRNDPLYSSVIQGMPSFRLSSYDIYLERMTYFWMHVRYLVAFSAEHAFSRWRFTRSRLKTKAMDALAKRVVPVPSSQVCVAYGDWSRQEGLKGYPCAPVKAFAGALQRRATVLLMDEYCTSQICSQCHHRLRQARLFTKMKRGELDEDVRFKAMPSRKEQKEIVEMSKFRNRKLKDTKIVLKSNRNVLRCVNSRCKANFWNRDVNAARNILELLKSGLKGKHGPRRLKPFRRGGQQS